MRRFILILFLIFLIGCTQPTNIEENKMADVVLIISQKNYQPIEFLDTKEQIEKAGFSTKVASVSKSIATAADGSTYKPDLTIAEINLNNFKALAIIGGPGASALLKENNLLKLIKDFNSKNKIVAAICFSPVILAETGILKNKRATVFPSNDLIKKLEQAGAIYTGENVTKDNNIITGNGPEAAEEFGKIIAKSLK